MPCGGSPESRALSPPSPGSPLLAAPRPIASCNFILRCVVTLLGKDSLGDENERYHELERVRRPDMTETMATTTTMTMPQAAVLVLRLQQWRSASNKNKKKFDLGALKEIVARAHGRVPPLAGFDSTSLGEESSAGYFSETIRLHLRYYGAEDEEEKALAGLPGSLILKSQGAYNETFEEMANKVSENFESRVLGKLFPRSSRLRF